MNEAEILAQWSDLQWRQANALKAKWPTIDLDDIHSEVLIGWVKGIRKYDPKRGTIQTYAGRAGLNNAIRFCQKESLLGIGNGKGRSTIAMYSLSATFPDGRLRFAIAVKEEAEPNSFPAEWWDTILAPLAKTERTVIIRHYRDGVSLNQIAHNNGREADCVRKDHLRAIEKLREAMGAA